MKLNLNKIDIEKLDDEFQTYQQIKNKPSEVVINTNKTESKKFSSDKKNKPQRGGRDK